ncbi:uncharacterized protein LOC131151688 [Malania oleifera]|uniref:uncharacterized protein LOC131151688 n=1 Tax=Malania oleifera TaxID=397392 RepID=UPI0025AE3D27|nr:uncharacterized protein LOC131151688 [Malania oleifera]
MTTLQLLLLIILTLQLPPPFLALSPCRTSCGGIAVNYPFGIDDGCGARQLRNMLVCNATASGDSLFFQTPSGSYKVRSIDYDAKTVAIFDPDMSTCSALQAPRTFEVSDAQYLAIPPSPDTAFALLNCSADSPLLNHYSYLCFNFAGHTCDELYTCGSFQILHAPATNVTPPCCFTDYNALRMVKMDMNLLDCTHYTCVYGTDGLRGVRPLDWKYGIGLQYAVPDMGCDRCARSGGTCGFDTESEGSLCLCSGSVNSTTTCGSVTNGREKTEATKLIYQALVFALGAIFYMQLL